MCASTSAASSFLVGVTQLLRPKIEHSNGVAVDFRLEGNLFNVRGFQATAKLYRERVFHFSMQVDYKLVAHTLQNLQSVLAGAVRMYSRMGLDTNKTQHVVSMCKCKTKKIQLPNVSILRSQLNICKLPPILTLDHQRLTALHTKRVRSSLVPQRRNELPNFIPSEKSLDIFIILFRTPFLC